jgi:hypothetical protein
MTSKILPDVPEIPMDQVRLKTLIYDAIKAALRDFTGTDVAGRDWLVFRPNERGWGTIDLPGPSYRKNEVWDKIDTIWNSTETATLTEYVWSHGGLKKTLSRDDGDPSREGWERFVWADLVHAPLLDLLPMVAAEELVRTGDYQPWHMEERTIEDAAADLADQICERRQTIVAVCPTIGLEITEANNVTAALGIDVKAWSDEERMIFLTQYHEEYLHDDMATKFSEGVITIRKQFDAISEEAALTAVTLALDSLKWGLIAATNNPSIFEEGPVILRLLSGRRVRTLRRGDTLLRSRSIPRTYMTPEAASRLPEMLAQLDQARALSAEIDSVLWLFGRACTAPLPRDILLDSAIGLEMLLVPSPGESRYRFALHGLAIIDGESAQTLEAELKKIYDLRSKAAHGGSSDAVDFERFAPRAKLLLAKAIQGAVHLIRTGELDVANTGGDIAKSVENLVKSRASSAKL